MILQYHGWPQTGDLLGFSTQGEIDHGHFFMIRIPILMYHSIDDSASAACVRPKRFEEQMAYLKRIGYEAIDLDAVYHYVMESTSVCSKPIVITFDDGYRDNLDNAYPVLEKYGMCATIFLATDYLGATNRWNAAEGVMQRPLMAWEDIRQALKSPLLSFQPHTCSHPKLTHIPLAQARQEMLRSKQAIEEQIGTSCHHFAYPYGDFNETVITVARKVGFRTACSTRWGHNRQGNDLYSLYRIGIRNQDRLSDFKRALGEPAPLWKYYLLCIRARLGF
jgi:peptidoglycan/xylan/chitin deacetylase (PgdA/CDA1 family)